MPVEACAKRGSIGAVSGASRQHARGHGPAGPVSVARGSGHGLGRGLHRKGSSAYRRQRWREGVAQPLHHRLMTHLAGGPRLVSMDDEGTQTNCNHAESKMAILKGYSCRTSLNARIDGRGSEP